MGVLMKKLSKNLIALSILTIILSVGMFITFANKGDEVKNDVIDKVHVFVLPVHYTWSENGKAWA